MTARVRRAVERAPGLPFGSLPLAKDPEGLPWDPPKAWSLAPECTHGWLSGWGPPRSWQWLYRTVSLVQAEGLCPPWSEVGWGRLSWPWGSPTTLTSHLEGHMAQGGGLGGGVRGGLGFLWLRRETETREPGWHTSVAHKTARGGLLPTLWASRAQGRPTSCLLCPLSTPSLSAVSTRLTHGGSGGEEEKGALSPHSHWPQTPLRHALRSAFWLLLWLET